MTGLIKSCSWSVQFLSKLVKAYHIKYNQYFSLISVLQVGARNLYRSEFNGSILHKLVENQTNPKQSFNLVNLVRIKMIEFQFELKRTDAT